MYGTEYSAGTILQMIQGWRVNQVSNSFGFGDPHCVSAETAATAETLAHTWARPDDPGGQG